MPNDEEPPKPPTPWARTQAEISILLEKAGVLDTHFSFIQSRGMLILQFPCPVTMDGRVAQMGIRLVISGVDPKNRDAKHQQLMVYLKNKLEAVNSGLVTLIQEFFPYIVVPGPSGTTVTMYEMLSTQLADGLRDGRIRQPELFPTGSKAPSAPLATEAPSPSPGSSPTPA
ncbi:MAG TPA: hypothetical protein VGL40_14255 [Bacillota bacterium]